MAAPTVSVSVIKGDGIDIDVTDATMAIVNAACVTTGCEPLAYVETKAGAGYFAEHGSRRQSSLAFTALVEALRHRG